MNNPFESIEARLSNIESLLLDIKHPPAEQNERVDRPMRMREAAAYLGVSLQTLYAYVHAGKVRPHKAGKFSLFYRADLDTFIRGDQPAPTEASQFIKTKKPQK